MSSTETYKIQQLEAEIVRLRAFELFIKRFAQSMVERHSLEVQAVLTEDYAFFQTACNDVMNHYDLLEKWGRADYPEFLGFVIANKGINNE